MKHEAAVAQSKAARVADSASNVGLQNRVPCGAEGVVALWAFTNLPLTVSRTRDHERRISHSPLHSRTEEVGNFPSQGHFSHLFECLPLPVPLNFSRAFSACRPFIFALRFLCIMIKSSFNNLSVLVQVRSSRLGVWNLSARSLSCSSRPQQNGRPHSPSKCQHREQPKNVA
jgi:hypothetical protein